MEKKIGWNNLIRIVSLGTFGALLAACSKLIPNNIVSLGLLVVGTVLAFGSSLTGLYLLKKNKV
ncbi:hypothetical protein M3215_09850 [Bacillus cytotoxicus]|uniref:Uncharacterized protein n=1 Tax=Bacillus cytotoxicus TaxID=580165 RepID=A0ACC6A5F9_9BACI|nr:hypothetical protein [Bacillus cytotoxicus]HDX9577261.1 hypothetical protein [Bacillus pseudomycoides]